jgi:hypothetical protein
MKRGWLFALVLSLGFTGSSVAASTEDGATLLERRCSVCHPAAKPKSAQKTPEQWEATVLRMIDKGAKLNAGEKKVLVDYLGKTYKP